MFASFLGGIVAWMAGSLALAVAGCFLWGLVSVLLSPCHLASIPLLVASVAGQGRLVEGREAAGYTVVYCAGLFTAIAVIGVLCALLGRMLGDVGPYVPILVGLVLLLVAVDMLWGGHGFASGGLPARLHVRGLTGALVLGLAYGVLSGSCTFGFIAPILALITVQATVAAGLLLIVAFAVGHCLPILAAASSTALLGRWLERGILRRGSVWFRRGAGLLIGLMGLYWLAKPFWRP